MYTAPNTHSHTKHFCLTVEGISCYLSTHCFVPSQPVYRVRGLLRRPRCTARRSRHDGQPVAVAPPTRCKRWEKAGPTPPPVRAQEDTIREGNSPLFPPPFTERSLRLGSHSLTSTEDLHRRRRLRRAVSAPCTGRGAWTGHGEEYSSKC